MITDARRLPDRTTLTADLCIIGTGPAGITLCRALAQSGLDVVVLESGDLDPDDATQELAGATAIGQPIDWFGRQELGQLRARQVGGSSNLWVGLCRPLDPVDFGPLPARGDTTWPFDRAEMDPYYAQAQEDCQLGPYDYDPAGWARAADLEPLASEGLQTSVLQFSPPTRFGTRYRQDLEEGPRLEVVVRANVTSIRTSPDGSGVSGVDARTLDGTSLTVAASAYVLAAGALENARLLLIGDDQRAGGIGNGRDLVGRFFMEHPAVRAARVIGRFGGLTEAFERIEPEVGGRPVPVRFSLSPTPAAMLEWGIPNATVMLRKVLFGEAFEVPEKVGGSEIRALIARRGPTDDVFAEIVWEQQPNPDSRVLLDPTARDALGMPRTQLDWRLTPSDHEVPGRVLSWLGHELGRLGVGRAEVLMGSQPTTERPIACNAHHLGTTRIDPDPARGVVDADLKVHGVANLWVAGSSVFPTGGWSNPTLTVVALARRLADQLGRSV